MEASEQAVTTILASISELTKQKRLQDALEKCDKGNTAKEAKP